MTIWHKHNTAQECKIMAIAPIANNIVSMSVLLSMTLTPWCYHLSQYYQYYLFIIFLELSVYHRHI